MGREATGREMSAVDAAMEVFRMETALGATDDDALKSAIESAVAAAHRACMAIVRDDILMQSEALDADEDNDLLDDGVAALIWYAIELDERLPPEMRRESYT